MRNGRRLALVLATGLVVGVGAAGSAAAGAEQTPLAHPTRQAVTVQNVEIPVPGQQPVRAYLVRPAHPARPRSLAGVLYLHWFEPPKTTQNRSEFLAEATAIATGGAVAILPQLTFPWTGDPVGDQRDVTVIEAQLAAITRTYRTLLAQPGVNPERTAVVGHDYGAMYGSVLARREHIRTEVFMAGDATWANWFDTYWLDLPAEQKAAYRALFTRIDPVNQVDGLGSRLYLQWAGRDQFVTPEVRAAFSAADQQAKVSLYDTAGHDLTEPAQADRLAWLSAALAL